MQKSKGTSALFRFVLGIAVFGALFALLSVVYPGTNPPAAAVLMIGLFFALSCAMLGYPLQIGFFPVTERFRVMVANVTAVCCIAAATYLLWDSFALLAQYPRPN